MSKVRRGPIKLTDDDQIVAANVKEENKGITVEGNATESEIKPPVYDSNPNSPPTHATTPTNDSNTWGGWFSTLKTKTTQGFDRLYELANQPVKLRDSPPGSWDHGAAVATNADALDELIKRAQNPNAHDGEAASPKQQNDLFKPLDMASEAITGYVQYGLARLKSPGDPDIDQSVNSTNTNNTSTLKRLSDFASKARDHWQSQINAVDDTVERTVDDAFRLYNGAVYQEQVMRKSQATQKQCKAKLRAMTPKEHESVDQKLQIIDQAFDSERLLESVVLIEKTDIKRLCEQVLMV